VDVDVARSFLSLLGDRGATGGEQDRHMGPGRIHDRASGVGCPDDDMDHHGLWSACNPVEAIRHADGDILVRYGDGFGSCVPQRCRFGERFNQRSKVGTTVAEKILDPTVA
jgi:hypothetical protein